ncbi:hypothetical protein DLV94_09010 [Shigella flexneri]|uniref:hypothetical protein n=1 Tax=Enterobacteriaceae TaxID=543 RepID=UPI000FA817F8|nr:MULTISPECIES: hypothetical protein [Enterobacteriaceae]EIK8829950.1 hypothetical protein [Shigella sonnei]HAY5688124.1 hypothetical protein [Shigella flexneri 2b]HAY6291381.1 hypothetical protein [Shigella flexneri 4c]EAA0661167.1 hypothetical protein [Shigella flexneri]EFF1974762.1 hypothetical protein [Escherichia coli]
MKQMTLIEMDGFLKGKCIPRDLNVNETNAEYLVRKFGELESKLETALRECRSAGITIDNLDAKCAALAAESAVMKAGHSYFSYGSEHNFEWHKTAEEAIESAEAAIDDYRGDACDGWSEEVDSICWGIIMQSSTKVGERPRNEDDCCDPAIDTICDYALLPNIETPATDAFLAEVRAKAFDDLCAAFVKHASVSGLDDGDCVTVKEATDALLHCAEQLHKGVHS